MREVAGVERPLVRACKRLGFAAWKFVSPGRKGAPDRIVFKGLEKAISEMRSLLHAYYEDPGPEIAEQHLRELLALAIEFVEAKAPKKGLRKDGQERRVKDLRALGFKVTVLDHPDKVKAWEQSH